MKHKETFIGPMVNDLQIIRVGISYGVMSKSGEWIIKPEWSFIHSTTHQFFMAYKYGAQDELSFNQSHAFNQVADIELEFTIDGTIAVLIDCFGQQLQEWNIKYTGIKTISDDHYVKIEPILGQDSDYKCLIISFEDGSIRKSRVDLSNADIYYQLGSYSILYQNLQFPYGLCAAKNVENKWGYVNKELEWVINPIYDYSNQFCSGLGLVQLKHRFGHISSDGNERIPVVFDFALDAINEIAICGYQDRITNNAIFYFSTNNQLLSTQPFYEAQHFWKGYSIGLRTNYDTSVLINDEFDIVSVENFFLSRTSIKDIFIAEDHELIFSHSKKQNEGHESMKNSWEKIHFKDEKYYLANTHLRIKNEKPFQKISPYFSSISTCFAKQNFLFGLINDEGLPLTNFSYEAYSKFSDGMAKVSRHGKIGFINESGEEVIQCCFDAASHFNNGLAVVLKNKQFAYIDKLGNVF